MSIVSSPKAQVHRAMTRLTVGYTLNDNHIAIYALFFKVF
jgi:hypothetical protein